MKIIFASFSKKLTFQRQLGITVTLGILFLALLSSVVGSWQGNKRVRDDLIEQGRRITENLARQSALALVFDSSVNAEDAVNATLAFPGVVGVKIFHADGRLLLSRGNNKPDQFLTRSEPTGGLQAAVLQVESADAWLFAAPVYSQPFSESPFGEAAPPEFLGRVAVAMNKAAMDRLTSDIFATNLTISFSFALLFLLLIRFLSSNMARPLDELSDSMERAQMGESQVRAKPGGPKDIAAMAYAFNNMMSVQEERETALRESEEKYRTLVESALSIVLRWDTRGYIVYINRYAENLFGYQPDELIGKHVVGTIVPEKESTSRDLSGLMSDVLVHPEKYRLNINENTKKSGERLWVMWTNRPIFDDTGKMIEVLSIGNDITERKHAEDALTESMRQLEEKELAKSRFLAAAGHDLRQPLAAANLFIDTLKLTNPTAQQGAIILQLDQAMSTFNGLLDTLLHVSKLDAGVIKPEFISIDVAEIFGWLEQNFAALTAEKQIDFRLHFPIRERLVIRSDIGLVNSVMMNLVSNAIKFTYGSPIMVSARRHKGGVLFQVWDTGIGISKECIEHIFDEFYQVGNPQRDRTRGLGLGLSIVKRALALLNSEVSCRSQAGRGSVFEFSLPLDVTSIKEGQQTVAATTPEEPGAKLFMQGKRFIVLDDDMLVAQAMVSLLEGMGGKVNCFHSAEDALHHASIEHADYFIIDYMLGGSLNGIQFLNLVRQKLGRPLHAVLMTGDTSAEFIREAANCDWPALHKPVNILRLKSALAAQAPNCPLA
jgi:PAS domain S-box-containing protein